MLFENSSCYQKPNFDACFYFLAPPSSFTFLPLFGWIPNYVLFKHYTSKGPSGHHYYLDTIGNTNYVYCTQIVLYNAFKIGKETPKQDVSNLSKLQTRLETLNADPCVYISFIKTKIDLYKSDTPQLSQPIPRTFVATPRPRIADLSVVRERTKTAEIVQDFVKKTNEITYPTRAMSRKTARNLKKKNKL